MPPLLTALVPNYNGRALLDTVVPSLLAQRDIALHVVVIDDASTDGSAEYALERWPGITVARRRINQGFAAAVNAGLRLAHTEFVALVNTDVELEPDWCARLVAALRAHPEAACATGKTLNASDRTRLDGAGNTMRWSGAASRRGFGELDNGQYDRPEEVVSACAGYAIYRRAAFEAVGRFDEAFVAYYEDVEWGLRAQLAGYGCRYEPAAVAYHQGGASYTDTAAATRWQRRNQLLMLARSYPRPILVRRAPQILLGQLILLYASARAGLLRPHLQGIADALRALTRTRRRDKRRRSPAGERRLATLMEPERTALRRVR